MHEVPGLRLSENELLGLFLTGALGGIGIGILLTAVLFVLVTSP